MEGSAAAFVEIKGRLIEFLEHTTGMGTKKNNKYDFQDSRNATVSFVYKT